MTVSCILTSHEKPDWCREAVASVLAQDVADWQLVIVDSGRLLAAHYFDHLYPDRRIWVFPSEETPAMRATHCLQSRAINLAWPHVAGELVCYLSDDDVYDSHAFKTFQQAAHAHPDQDAWYASAERVESRGPGRDRPVGWLWADVVGGLGGVSLCCRADGMQVCHRTRLHVSWPEDPAIAATADGHFLDALGRKATIHPLSAVIGKHRHTPASTFTRPAS